MNLIHQYPTTVDIWEHKELSYFLNVENKDILFRLLGITPNDPNQPSVCYFNVWYVKQISNKKYGNVFQGKTYNCFMVEHKNETPTVEFYFDLILKAREEFLKIFTEKTKGTNISHHAIPELELEVLRPEIQNCIDIWGKTVQGTSMN